MFSLKDDPNGFVRLTISGRIDADEMRAGLDAFLDRVGTTGKTDFLYVITDFRFPDLAALGVEFGYIPRLFRTLKNIGKVAVVSDAAWLRTTAEAEGKLIPGLTIRAFAMSDEDAAVAWLLERS